MSGKREDGMAKRKDDPGAPVRRPGTKRPEPAGKTAPPARPERPPRQAKKASKPRKLKMTDLQQVRALSHPLRLRLLELFAQRARTTKQAAEELGEAPTKLYHHVAALEKAGLVRLCETRPNRGATEKYFEAVANRFEGGAEAAGLGKKGARRDHAAIGLVLFDQARQELIQALGRVEEAQPRNLMAVRGLFRAAPKAVQKLQQ